MYSMGPPSIPAQYQPPSSTTNDVSMTNEYWFDSIFFFRPRFIKKAFLQFFLLVFFFCSGLFYYRMSLKRNKPLSQSISCSFSSVCVYFCVAFISFFFSGCMSVYEWCFSYRCIMWTFSLCIQRDIFFLSHAFLWCQIIDTQEKLNRLSSSFFCQI